MPEVITRYPDIVLKILRDAGIECGTGAAPEILLNCPPERFCSLPTGEICVYGLDEISKATQITLGSFSFESLVLSIIMLVIGFALGILYKRKI